MPQEIQVGRGVIYGLVSGAIDVYAATLLQSARPTHKFDVKDVKDANAFDAAATATNEHIDITVDFEVVAPSGAASRANAAAQAVFIAPLSKVVLSAFPIAAINGTYCYRGDASIEVPNEKGARFTLPNLRRYADPTQNTLMTTTVSG